jgi:thiamine-monophosphate kinase
MSVEDTHFRREWLSLEEIGWRAAMGSLSDLAAAGARCVGVLAAVSAPHDSQPSDLVALMRGVGDAVRAGGGVVLGGDLTASPKWIVSLTVIGRAERPMRRSGAEPGDGLWVTGRLGGARAALHAWRSGRIPDPACRAAFVHPEARLATGAWLAAHGAHALMDLSDGLAGDAGHLAAASGVAIEVDLDRLPLAPGVTAEATTAGREPAELAAEGGEDYELLAVLPPAFGDAEAAACERETGVSLRRIGSITAGSGVRLLLRGRAVALRSFDHFA